MGVFCDKILFHRKSSFVEYSPYTCECNVCGIKFEKKVMRFYNFRVEKISLFRLKKCAVNYF